MPIDMSALDEIKWTTRQRTINADGDVTSEQQVPAPTLVPVEVLGPATVKFATTVYDRDGKAERQFVRVEPDKAAREALWRTIAAELHAGIKPLDPIQAAPRVRSREVLTAYPVGDHHLGMLSWKPETGAHFDIEIGERLLLNAMDNLVSRSEPTEYALIAILGDFFHYDSFDTLTPEHKNLLDSDTRFPRMVRAGLRVIEALIARALEAHGQVHVIFEPGNHDPASTVWITETFALLYRNEPRVTIDTSPRHVHYYHFGKVMIGTHHGDKTKMQDLPLLMAVDQPEAWGSTAYRYWYTGHRHHQQQLEVQGCLVEMFGILPPADAYAAHQGYRQSRQMKAITYHREYGEVSRLTVNPRMLEH